MATVGKSGLIKYKSTSGDTTIFYPYTLAENVYCTDLSAGLDNELAYIKRHIDNTTNPHEVTAEQVGALSSIPVDMLSDDGVTYTCTIPWITELTAGVCFIGIPKKTSASSSVRLIVNDLVQKPLVITRSDSTGTFTYPFKDDWLRLNCPVRIMYIGTTWIVEGCARPIGEDVLGDVNSAKYAVGTNAVGTPALRNEYFVTTETTPTYNGQIAWVYG